MILVLLLTLVLISCAPKVREACPQKEEALSLYSTRYVPKDFRIYGILRYGPLKFPMLLAKFNGFYTVRVANVEDVSIEGERLCFEGKCYLLPAPPEYLVFGRVLSGKEKLLCDGGALIFSEELGVYEKKVVIRGKKIEELSVRNRRNGMVLTVTFGAMTPEGFFRSLSFKTDSGEFKLEIEGVEF